MRLIAPLPVVLAMAAPALADFGNVITNGDFENGLTGWSVAGPSKAGYNYNDPALPPQTYSGTGPVDLRTYQGTSGGSASAFTSAYSGSSLGWFRTGDPSTNHGSLPGGFLYNYVYQDIYVTPNVEYTIESATWQASAWNGYNNAKNDANEIAAMFLVRIDGQIDSIYDPNDSATFAFRSTCWNLASQGNWISKSLAANSKFTSTTGRVQVQLHFQDGFYDRTYTGENTDVGFDNLYIGLNRPVVPEPSSALALFGGLVGLAPLVRRKQS